MLDYHIMYDMLYAYIPVAWHPRTQSCVALLTTETHYFAVSCTAQEIVNVRSIILEFVRRNKKEMSRIIGDTVLNESVSILDLKSQCCYQKCILKIDNYSLISISFANLSKLKAK